MSGYYNMDLSGTSPENARTNDIFYWSKTGVQIFFSQPVYADSIVIKTTDGLQTVLEKGSDWDVKDADIDWTATARAQTVDSTFSKTLVKSVTIIRVQDLLPLKIAASYQTLYNASPTAATANDVDTTEFTPPAWIDAMRRIGVLEQLAARVTDESALSDASPKLLEYDATGALADNYITGETYTVNTYSGVRNIRLVQGTFYRKDLSLTTDASKILVEGTDFICVGFNRAKTQGAASDTDGAFDLIQITTDYAGDITIDYRAVGGDPTTSDIATLYSSVKSIVDYLSGQEILSAAALPSTPVVKTIFDTLSTLEDKVRSLINGSPTYGDTTTGITAVKHVLSSDTTKLHWFTIGQLYKVQIAGGQSSDVITADRMRFRMNLVRSGIQADVIATVDIDNPSRNMQIDASGVLQNVGFVPYGSANSDAIVYPQFRFIWNDNAGIITGGYLQIGLNLSSGSETISIEDLSGTESCFLLDQTNGSATSPISPQDDDITLPDGQSVWSSSGTDSKVATAMMPNPTGYLVFEGTQKLTTFDTTASSAWAVSHQLPAFFRIEDIKSIVFDLADPTNLIGQKVRIDVSDYTSGGVTGIAPLVFSGNGMNLKVVITQDASSGAITVLVSIDNALPSGVTSEVRYITAEV